MKTAREKILTSTLVSRGEVFTVSMMADAIGETKAHMTNLLNHLAVSGKLTMVTKGRYAKCERSRYLITKLWDKNLKV